jgi:hypothetical protein
MRAKKVFDKCLREPYPFIVPFASSLAIIGRDELSGRAVSISAGAPATSTEQTQKRCNQMSELKYSRNVMKAPIELAPKGPPLPSLNFSAAGYGVNASWILLPVIQPIVMHETPIKHDFPQFLFFLGSDPRNIGDFGAEVEISLGPEGEKHTVTSPSVLYVSPGLVHCPISYKKVDKPALHLDIFFAPEYIYTDVPTAAGKRKTGPPEFGRHILKAPVGPAQQGPPLSTMRFFFAPYGANATCILVPVLQPRLMEDKPHKHDFHQFLCLLGSNPLNIGDFDAEIEVWLGEEGEKHTITSPTILHYPPGLVHNPINYKRVGKPVFHLDIFFANDYVKIPFDRATPQAQEGK